MELEYRQVKIYYRTVLIQWFDRQVLELYPPANDVLLILEVRESVGMML